MKNLELARVLNQIADLLEIKEENPFRIRAYRKAAQNLEDISSEDLEKLVREDRLTEIPGIGHDLALKTKEFLSTGRIKLHQDLLKKTPAGFLELMTVPGVGPKTAKLLSEKLKIKNINQLERYAAAHKIAGLPGLKQKTEENIVKGIEFLKRTKERTPLAVAYYTANHAVAQLKKISGVNKISPAGSLRRMKETVRDIDILVTSIHPKEVMDGFVNLSLVQEVLAHGATKASIRSNEGIQIDLRVVEPSSFGAALAYFTGSKEHNIKLRKMAVKKGLKVNEYGVFRVKSGRKIAGKTESGIYEIFGLPFIPPEMREDRGEIEAGLKGKLPGLIEMGNIKGDLHVHSDYSDGADSVEDIARACQKMGYQYVAICDHSQSLTIARGLSPKELSKKIDRIKKLNKKLKKIRVLVGTEVDILGDGSLDYKDEILKQLDFVIAAIHTGFKQTEKQLTDRTVKAMKNRYVHAIAHPTGRLMEVRDAYKIDLEKIFKVAKDTNTALEISAFPARLDLNDRACQRAKENGVRLVISTDAHTISQLNNMFFGVSVAKRGWLEKKDILNTFSLEKFLKAIKHR